MKAKEDEARWEIQFRWFTVALIAIGALLTCSGCGRAMPGYVNDTTDVVFVPYMEAFGTECSVPFTPIRIGFGLYDKTKAGVCMTYSKQEMLGRSQVYEEILINKEYWDTYGEEKRKWLIFHEMGHCALGKGHSENEDDIMYYQIPEVAELTQERIARLCR